MMTDVAVKVIQDHLPGPTPCAEFNVGELVNHIAGAEGHEPSVGFTMETLERIARGRIPTGPNPNIALFEIVIHGWDLAKSTGQEFEVSNEIGEAGLAITERIFLNNCDLRGEDKQFGTEITVPPGASPFDTTLALTGRDRHWSR